MFDRYGSKERELLPIELANDVFKHWRNEIEKFYPKTIKYV